MDACITHMNPVEKIDCGKTASQLSPNGVSHDAPASSFVKPDKGCYDRAIVADTDDISSGVSTSSNSVVGATSESCPSSSATPTEMVLPHGSSKSAKVKSIVAVSIKIYI